MRRYVQSMADSSGAAAAAAPRRKRRRRCGAGAGAADEQQDDATTTTTTGSSTSTTASSEAAGAADVTLAAADSALEEAPDQEEHSISSGSVAAVVPSLSSSSSQQPQQHYSDSTYFSNCLPSELIAQHVAGFCDRKSQAALEATCAKFRCALRNTNNMTWHFPLSGKFLITGGDNANNNNNTTTGQTKRLRFVVLSSSSSEQGGTGRCRCRRLVSYKSKKDRFNEGRLEVWDAALGCLVSLPRVRFAARSKPVKPAISSDSRWVACGNITYGSERNFQDGILLIRLPGLEQQQHNKRGCEVVTQRILGDYEVTSVQFLSNNNNNSSSDDADEDDTVLVFSHLGMDGFLCCKVSVAVGTGSTATITVTEPTTYIRYPVHELGPDIDDPGHPLQLAAVGGGGFSTVGYGRMAVYNSNSRHGSRSRRSLEAFVYSSYDSYVVIRDILRNVVITRKVPKDTVEVFDMAFSPDGKRLLLSHFEEGLSILENCDTERIEDLGEIEILRLTTTDLDDNNNAGGDSIFGSEGHARRRTSSSNNSARRSQYGYFAFSPDGKRAVALNMVPQRQFPQVIDLEHKKLLVSSTSRSGHWDDDLSWRRFLFGW